MIGRRLLDRYLLWQWIRIFLLTAVGFPLVQVLLQLTDKLNRLLERGVGAKSIALSQVYALPENMAQMMPAAALFATVFTIGPFSRHSELTAAKSSGVSFHRLVVPLFLVAALSAVGSFYVSELATRTSARQLELEKEKQAQNLSERFNFVYRGEGGWVYTIRLLDTRDRRIEQPVLERPGQGRDYPTIAMTADSGVYVPADRAWRLYNGAYHVLAGTRLETTLRFATAQVRHPLSEAPRMLLLEAKDPSEMTYRELGDYITTMRRSGNETRELEVGRALKIALPAACLIIALFGAPLAVTNPRAGAAVGIAISLGTTIVYLLFINLAKAFGNGGLMEPVVAAWLPNGVFLAMALVLLWRVRT